MSLHDWSTLTRLPIGARVQITLDSSEVIDAKVASVTDSGLQVVRSTGTAILARSSVVQVVSVESRSEGAQRGIGIGVVTSLGAWGACKANGSAGCTSGFFLAAPLFIGTFAATGSLVPRRTLVYQR